mmetsp:Transcript_58/g.161  ORF Transcript_58/g.161 Transcript_58/m.161 type:complete len:508 (+) Transcript_58:78-1601(+)
MFVGRWTSKTGPKVPLMAPESTPSSTPSQDKRVDEAEQARRVRHYWRAFYTVLLVVTSVGNTVCFKQMTTAMPNYGWYLTQLSSVVYVPIFGFLAKQKGALLTDRPMLQRFAVMGVFDGLSGILTVLGGIHTSGTLQVVIGQLVIPSTLILSICFLGKRFHLLQYTGATSIVIGIVLATVYSASGGGDNEAIFVMFFAMAVLPAAMSSIFKEVAFKGFDGDLDINVIQFWVAVFQVGVNFLAMPIYSLQALGPQQVPPHLMFRQVEEGSKCLFLLEDSITTDCGGPGQRDCDNCAAAWQPVFRYLFFNLLFNISSILVIKHGSAALSFLVSTLRMPLSSVAFSSPVIMGGSATQLNISDFLALVVIILGLSAYRQGSRLQKRQRQASTSSPASPRSSEAWLWSSPTDSTNIATKPSKGPHYEPVFTLGIPAAEPVFVLVPAVASPPPRSADRVRSDLIRRLGAAPMMDSPKYRPPQLPSPPSEDDDDVNFSMAGLPQEQPSSSGALA